MIRKWINDATSGSENRRLGVPPFPDSAERSPVVVGAVVKQSVPLVVDSLDRVNGGKAEADPLSLRRDRRALRARRLARRCRRWHVGRRPKPNPRSKTVDKRNYRS